MTRPFPAIVSLSPPHPQTFSSVFYEQSGAWRRQVPEVTERTRGWAADPVTPLQGLFSQTPPAAHTFPSREQGQWWSGFRSTHFTGPDEPAWAPSSPPAVRPGCLHLSRSQPLHLAPQLVMWPSGGCSRGQENNRHERRPQTSKHCAEAPVCWALCTSVNREWPNGAAGTHLAGPQ